VFFWPIYLPTLLKRGPSEGTEKAVRISRQLCSDDLSCAIGQVEAELDVALKSLDGWAENVLAGESARLAELRTAWRLQADRIRELDELLKQPEFVSSTTDEALGPHERIHSSLQARQENIDRLRQVRRQLHEDLLGTLAWVRELVTMIHLAKFTGAPASRAEELIAQIAASVQGLSEVSAWKEETMVGSA
jgi:hypothetical protein